MKTNATHPRIVNLVLSNRMAPNLPGRIASPPRIKSTLLTVLVFLCAALVTTAVLGQSSYVWTNQNRRRAQAGPERRQQGETWLCKPVPPRLPFRSDFKLFLSVVIRVIRG